MKQKISKNSSKAPKKPPKNNGSSVLPTEKTCGIETFYTTTNGIKGNLRSTPEDFIVTELSASPNQKNTGRYTIAEITALSWETHRLVRELAKQLNISRKRIEFAGTKDKRSLSTQHMSFFDITPEQLQNIHLKDVHITPLYTSDKHLWVGLLHGNHFTLTLRNITQNNPKKQITQTISELQQLGGFPNFFGIQRFGAVRPITHLVGKHIVKGDFEQAVLTYLCYDSADEEKNRRILRKNLAETHDYKHALHVFPDTLGYEKAMLNTLIHTPTDFTKALLQLPKNLLTMFVYAYQSYLFNKILSIRIKKKLPLNQAIEGDIILPKRKDSIQQEPIPVTSQNITKINKEILKGNAYVSAPLIGYETTHENTGKMGDIQTQVLSQEHLKPQDFIIPEIRFLSSKGLHRSLIAPIHDLTWELISDPSNNNNLAALFDFSLDKGTYATSLLREIMKADLILQY